MQPATILVIDDDVNVQRTLSSALAPGYTVRTASTGEEALEHCEHVRPDIVLLDVMLPQMSGMAVLRTLKKTCADVPVIMMTAFAEVQTAVQAIKLGAIDYLQKPIDGDAVLRRLDQLGAHTPSNATGCDHHFIAESSGMKRIWRAIERFGPTDIPILLQGETGTGKSLIAESIHRVSKRAQGAFVAIDCATIPEQLAESELFGYEDGAFTGAGRRKRGRVSYADRGTLFLDEIGTLSVGTQSKLLTLIEHQNFVPLGARSLQPTSVDVRFISATNVPLHRAVENGSFRADLYHRLNGVVLELPPLRERHEDIEPLARHFVGELSRRYAKRDLDISGEALNLMREYRWPGNVRELQRVLSIAVVVANRSITPDDLPDHIRQQIANAADPRPAESGEVDEGPASINLREIKEWAGREAQKRVILELQQRTHISRQALARALGVDPKTLRTRLKEISADRSKPPASD